MQNLSMKHRCIIGFTLFSMFFGAGNLIFPPLLGAQAGRDTILAMAGLGLTAVLLPILSVMAVARHNGLTNLVGSIHPVLAILFAVFVHLMIGPAWLFREPHPPALRWRWLRFFTTVIRLYS